MLKALVAFWLGFAAHYGLVWLSTHPEDRAALYSRVRKVFTKNEDAPK
jgi:hypothetical protein